MNPAAETGLLTSRRANLRVVALCLTLVAGMAGLAYASVPLYRLFCQVTGYGGTTRTAETAPKNVLDRAITIRFDANVAPGLNWEFAPLEREVKLKLGEVATVRYVATNRSRRATTGTATFNVTPESAGIFFNKLECFCFTETTLGPGERLEMPVVFFVDPEIVDDEAAGKVNTITLSYTFFAVQRDSPVAGIKGRAGNGS